MIQNFLLGTYTRKESKGLYAVSLNREEKKLENLTVISEVDNPTYLDTSSDGSLLFAVLKDAEDKGGLISYKQNDQDQYDVLDSITEVGAPPCYVAYDEKREYLYSANYHKGEVALHRVDPSGQLTLLDSVQHEGKGPHKNQDAPHAHYMDRTKDDLYVVACDLGTDEVITYDIQEDTLIQKHVYKAPAGTGPRHLVFHPTLDIAYLVGELTSEILVLTYHTDGSFTWKETLSSLPDSYKGENSGAAVRISSDGTQLYASNRGHNSIVVYEIDAEEGTLTTAQWQSTFGNTPRDFNLDETGEFIIVGHQDTPHLTLLQRNQADGSLSLLQKEFYAPEVVCVHGIPSHI